MSRLMQRWMQGLVFYLLLPWLYTIALLPWFWLYKLSDLCFFLVYYIFRYRKKVVLYNLGHVFSHKTPAELKQLSKSFYHYLCDLLLEHLKALTMPPAEAIQRCKLKNPELLQDLYAQGRHIILVTGHYGNWEWAANTIALQTNYQLYALYRPLSNFYFDGLLLRLRTRFSKKTIPQGRAWRILSQDHCQPTATAILADQAPLPAHAYTTSFLGKPTYVSQGLEKLIRKCDNAVIYISNQRIQRGHYVLKATLLTDKPTNEPDTWITQSYIQHLEADIYQQPATWLWSHRRWKD